MLHDLNLDIPFLNVRIRVSALRLLQVVMYRPSELPISFHIEPYIIANNIQIRTLFPELPKVLKEYMT